MARGELIGLCECPECGFVDAEVRPDKSGSPYRFCPDCTAQYFSRGVPHKVKHLLAKVRKITTTEGQSGTPAAPDVAMATPAAPDPAPAKPARKKFDMADL